jgi:hypothetical protein
MAAASLAQRYRAHRAEMDMAMQQGITPAQAREQLALREARANLTRTMARAAAQGAIPKSAATFPVCASETEKPLPWWQRD